MSTISNRISKKITKALWDFNMLQAGDRVLIALSGGKDSTTLLLDLAGRRKHWPVAYELACVYLRSDFASDEVQPFVERMCAQVDVPLTVINANVIARVKTGEKMNCYWCSQQRRMEIMEYAVVHGFNKICFGHHLDDIIETYIMNLMQFGKHTQGMLPVLPLDKYPLTFLRPLVYIEEHEIIKHVQDLDLSKYTCKCEFGENSERKRIRRVIADLTQNMPSRKQNLLKVALSKPNQSND